MKEIEETKLAADLEIRNPETKTRESSGSTGKESNSTKSDSEYSLIEEKSRIFVTKNCKNQPEREVKSESRIKEDKEEL